MPKQSSKKRAQLPPIPYHRLKKLVELHFDIVADRSADPEIVILCPVEGCPDQSGNRSINLEKSVTNCWRCGRLGGHVLFLLRDQGIEVEESLDDVADTIDGVSPTDIDIEADDKVAEPPGDHAVPLPKGFMPLADEPTGVYARYISAMARRKNLYLEDFIEAGVGFTKSGMWEPYAIFPVVERGRVVYYQGRTYATDAESSGSTKRFPSKKHLPFGASFWIYNYDEAVAPSTETLIIVESILNVLSLKWELRSRGITGVVPVAVFKHKVSRVQARKLAVSPAREYCFMYDDDATEKAWIEAKNVASNKVATVVRMPRKVDANDNASLAVDLFLSRQEYSPVNEIEGLI